MNRTLRCILLSFLVAGVQVAGSAAVVMARAGAWREAPAQVPQRAGANAVPAGLNFRAEFLEAGGVQKSAMLFELQARNSYMAVVTLGEFMRKGGWRTLIVVNDPPHVRRLSCMWTDVFEGRVSNLRLSRRSRFGGETRSLGSSPS